MLNILIIFIIAFCFHWEGDSTEVLYVVADCKAFSKAFQRKAVVENVAQALSHNLEMIIDTSSA